MTSNSVAQLSSNKRVRGTITRTRVLCHPCHVLQMKSMSMPLSLQKCTEILG